jgi:hypothetical protein
VFSELRWEVIVCFVSPLILTHWIQTRKLNSNCLQFHQYQQNKQSTLILSYWTQTRKFREVIVCFVVICGIDDHYCLSFLVCVQWVKMRGDCLFNHLPSYLTEHKEKKVWTVMVINSTNIKKTNNHLLFKLSRLCSVS